MSLITIQDIAHVRFAAPDLAEMARFLAAFGLRGEAGPRGWYYARGAGPAPVLHVTEPGDPRFVALGLRASSPADLRILAGAEGAVIEPLDWPGGGEIVRLHDPDGNLVEVVAGQRAVDEDAPPPAPPCNTAEGRARAGTPVRLRRGASDVRRLGHVALEVTDFRVAEAWYKSRFGLITSDEIQLAPGAAIGAFLRCDLGETPTDHHTIFLLQSPRAPALNHAAFEVAHLDDLMVGRDHLLRDGRTPAWGVGRHILGSQVFDYWKDPWGHELEHWTDGDLFARSAGSNVATFADLLGVQWGPRHPLAPAA